MKSFSHYALALLAAAAISACSHGPSASPIVQNGNPPDWVNRGNGAFKDQAGSKVFYGVGILQGVHNIGLAIPAVDDRGRAEIAKVMNSYVTVLGKDYASSVTANDPSKSSEEQMVSETMSIVRITCAMNFDPMPTDEDVRRRQDIVYAQDSGIVDTQRPERIPVDLRQELHHSSDLMGMKYRRWLDQLGVTYGTHC